MKRAHTEAEALAYRAGYSAAMKHKKDPWRKELNELRRDKRRLDALERQIKNEPLCLHYGYTVDMQTCRLGLGVTSQRSLRKAIDDMRGTKR